MICSHRFSLGVEAEGPLSFVFLATLVGSRLFTFVGKLAFVLSVGSLLVILGLPESAIF